MSCNHQQSCLYQVPIFNHLTDQFIASLTQKLNHFHLERGEYLYTEGEKLNALYIVQSGSLRVYRLNAEGDQQLMRLMNSGDFIGEWSLFSEGEAETPDNAQALTDVKVCVLYKEDFMELLMQQPSVSIKILSTLSERLDSMEERYFSLTALPVEERIITYLKTLPVKENGRIELPMARKELATYLGTTPETLSRRFKELEEKEIIRVHKIQEVELLDAE